MTFDPTGAVPVEEESFDPTGAVPINEDTQVPVVGAGASVLELLNAAAKKVTDPAVAAAETLTAGIGSIANLAITAPIAAARATGEALAGGSFLERFEEDQKRYGAAIERTIPYMPETLLGKSLTEGIGTVFETISKGFGDVSYFIDKSMGMSDEAASTGAAIAYALPAVLPMLPMLKGVKVKPTVEPSIKPFAEQYPAFTRRIEASHIGDAPFREARIADPSSTFAGVVEGVLNKELGITDAKGLSVADRVNLVVQKYVALSGEPIPVTQQRAYASSVSNKLAEMQGHIDRVVATRPKLRVRMKTPAEIEAAAQAKVVIAEKDQSLPKRSYEEEAVFQQQRRAAAKGASATGNVNIKQDLSTFKELGKESDKWQEKIDARHDMLDKQGVSWEAQKKDSILESLYARRIDVDTKAAQKGFDGANKILNNVLEGIPKEGNNSSIKYILSELYSLTDNPQTGSYMMAQYTGKALDNPATVVKLTEKFERLLLAKEKPQADYDIAMTSPFSGIGQGQKVNLRIKANKLAETAHARIKDFFMDIKEDSLQTKEYNNIPGQRFKQRGAAGDLYVKDFDEAINLASKQRGTVGTLTPQGWRVTLHTGVDDITGLQNLISSQMSMSAKDRAITASIAKSQRGIFDIQGLEQNVQAAKEAVRKSVLAGITNGNITPQHVLHGTTVSKLQEIVNNGRLESNKYGEISATNLNTGDFPVYGKGAGIIAPPESYIPSGRAAEVFIDPKTSVQDLQFIIGDKVMSFDELTQLLGRQKAKGPSAADAAEIRRILNTSGKLQRGIFDIEGLEQNIPAAKRAIEKATGTGWTVNNPDATAQYVKEVMQGNESAIAASRKAFGDNVVKKARRAIYAHDFDIRTSLQNAGPAGQTAHARMVVQNGATMAAKVRMDAVNEKIFNKFSHEDRVALDELTRLRRIVQIDKYKGVAVVRHEGGVTGPMALARIDQIKQDLGSAKYNEIHNASTSIFEEQKILLDRLLGAGLIDQTLHGKLYNLDYTRTEYLDIVDPAIPIASHVRNMPTSIRSSGIPELGRGKLTAVNIDSQALLMEDVARVENRIARNNTLQAIRRLAIENSGNDIARLPTKGSVKVLANGDEAVRMTPEGWTSIGVRVEGKQRFIQMRDEFAEQFVARPEAMPEWLAVIIRTLSGSQLLKATATGYNPGFVIAGIPMDILHTWVSTTGTYSPHLPMYLAQMGRDLTKTAKDAWQKTGAWEDAMREGLGSSYLTHESRGLTDPSKSIQSQMAPRLGKIRTALSYINDSADVWIRLAYRNRLIESGVEPWKATAMARDRLDYFQGGMVTKAFDTAIPYLNVSIQATGKAVETVIRDPYGALTKAAWIVGASASFKLASMITSPETDKGISARDKIRNFNITFGDSYFVLDANGNKRYMYIPLRLDQVAMPLNASVVGALEKAEYGKAPEGMLGSALGQIAPVNSALPIPTVDAISTYIANYDAYTGGAVYRGPVVKPESEIRTFGEGTPTSGAAQMIGAATGMSPMRLEAAAGKLINTNNFYIQALGGANKFLFQGADPREQAAATVTMLQQVPGLRSIIKLTSPGVGLVEELQKAEEAVGSQLSPITHGLNDLVFQYEHQQNSVTLKTIQTYINNQPPQERQKLADHAKFTLTVNKIMEHYEVSAGIPPRSWWIASAKASPEARAQAFYSQWISASSEDRTRMLGIANSLQNNGVGYLSPDFQRAFAAERKLLGDDHR